MNIRKRAIKQKKKSIQKDNPFRRIKLDSIGEGGYFGKYKKMVEGKRDVKRQELEDFITSHVIPGACDKKIEGVLGVGISYQLDDVTYHMFKCRRCKKWLGCFRLDLNLDRW